jgi:uncharacterized LabA/DUF88 family protein
MNVAIYIDGPNVKGMTNGSNGIRQNIDFKAFIKHVRGMLKGQGKIVSKKIFYDCLRYGNRPNGFISEMEKLGFDCIPVPLKNYRKAAQNAGNFHKSRTDQMITIRMLQDIYQNSQTRPDKIVLVSGDSDYEFLIKTCEREGIKTEVWATQKTLSSNLINVAGIHFLFENFPHLLIKQKNNGAMVA